MIVQIRRSKTFNMDGRWWWGTCRYPSKKMMGEKLIGWTMPRAWFIGIGPLQIRLWPGMSKQTAEDVTPKE